MRYQSDWISLYDMISHIQAVERCEAKEGVEDAVKALYEGKVESRMGGSQTPIESHLWASAKVFQRRISFIQLACCGNTSAGMRTTTSLG